MGNGPAPPIPRLGIAPYNWNTECLRGDAEAPGWATAFPQALGLAAAFRYHTRAPTGRLPQDGVPGGAPGDVGHGPCPPTSPHSPRSPELIYRVANATATEVRAKHNDFTAAGRYSDHTGLSCFSPVLNIMRHPLWGRNQVPARGGAGLRLRSGHAGPWLTSWRVAAAPRGAGCRG